MSASATAATVRPPTPREEGGEGRQRDELGEREEREHRQRLRDPDRAAVARREHERVDQALLALGDERARQAEQRGEDDRRPRAGRAQRRRPLPRGSAKWKIVSAARTNSSIAGSGLLRAQLEQQVLARQRGDVGDVASCEREPARWRSARRAPARGSRRPRASASSASVASSSSGPVGVERVERLVEEQRAPARAGATRQSPSRCCIPREKVETRSWRTSQRPNRSSSMPIRSPRSGRGRAGRRASRFSSGVSSR